MSNNEKTKNKLMETMRMTKSDPGKKVDAVDTNQTKAPEDDKAIKKKQNKPTIKKAVNDTEILSVDPYQTSRRVWPD